MTHVIDHNDMSTRTWVCTRCGCTCLSKNPWSRNTHAEGSGDMTSRMYLNVLRNLTTVKMRPAHPPRPKEEARVYMQPIGDVVNRDTAFCYVRREQDICIYLDPGNENIGDTGKPLDTTGDRLLQFFKLIREVDEATLGAYICAETNGHDWTDDPLELLKVNRHKTRYRINAPHALQSVGSNLSAEQLGPKINELLGNDDEGNEFIVRRDDAAERDGLSDEFRNRRPG